MNLSFCARLEFFLSIFDYFNLAFLNFVLVVVVGPTRYALVRLALNFSSSSSVTKFSRFLLCRGSTYFFFGCHTGRSFSAFILFKCCCFLWLISGAPSAPYLSFSSRALFLASFSYSAASYRAAAAAFFSLSHFFLCRTLFR